MTSDTIAAAYNSVRLWAQAVAEAETDEVAAVLKAVRKQSMSAPEGVISIDGPTLHTWRPVYIGRIRGDGQFDIVWTSDKAVRPIPFPTSRPQAQWEAFLDELYRSWGGWANPGRPAGTRDRPRPGPASRARRRRRRSPGRAAAASRPRPRAGRPRPGRRVAPAGRPIGLPPVEMPSGERL